ncbi:MinD/ParA family protein [Anaerovibrio sp.]|uniref:MinD/ParA family protein n=1 Tax=Anaerovibrio sp. TaxID=1872532 RepID=UPI003F17DCD4
MEDQATRLRKLVERKNSDGAAEQPGGGARPEMAASKPGARVIAVTSGKGGVGKTNLTVNLAIALGKKGKRVIVVDADLGTANVDVLLGTSSKHTLLSLARDDIQLEDVIVRGPYGVSYISGGSGMEHAGEMTVMQRQMIFNKLAACDEWADIILVDTGAGVGRNVLDFIMASDEVVLVITPEPTALTDGYAVLKSYRQLEATQPIRLVVNRVYDIVESSETANKLIYTAERFLHMELKSLGFVFDDASLMKAVRRQVPLMAAYPDSLAARCVEALANSLVSGRQQQVKLGWQGFLRKFFHNMH